MKMCPHCKVNIEGEGNLCPLCQNELRGEGTLNKWPYAEKLKKQSIIYKIQLFILVSIAIVAAGLDFMFDLHGRIHWSLLVVGFVLVIQLLIRKLYKTYCIIPRLVTLAAAYFIVLLMAASLYIGIWDYCIYGVVPIILSSALVINFIFTLFDKSGNAMVYLLITLFVNIVFYWIVLSATQTKHMIWSISLLISAIGMLAIFIFKGRKTVGEIQKRLSV